MVGLGQSSPTKNPRRRPDDHRSRSAATRRSGPTPARRHHLTGRRHPVEAALSWSVTSEYRPNKRPFPRVHRVSPGHQTAVNRRLGVVSAVIAPFESGEIPHFSVIFPTLRTVGTTATLACRSVSQPLVLHVWCLLLYQPNMRAWGDARHGGKRGAAVEASLRSRCVRIFSITTGSSIQAMTAEHRTCVRPLDLFSQSGCARSKRSKTGSPRTALGR